MGNVVGVVPPKSDRVGLRLDLHFSLQRGGLRGSVLVFAHGKLSYEHGLYGAVELPACLSYADLPYERRGNLPLMLAGLGVIAGSLMGGRVAGHGHRLRLISVSFLVGALVVSLVFTTHISAWITVGLSFGAVGLMFVSTPVAALLLTELAGQSRATATGMFVVSNQLGVLGGASIGGLMLSLGGFPMVGMFCSAAAAAAAVVVRYKVREPAASFNRKSFKPGNRKFQ